MSYSPSKTPSHSSDSSLWSTSATMGSVIEYCSIEDDQESMTTALQDKKQETIEHLRAEITKIEAFYREHGEQVRTFYDVRIDVLKSDLAFYTQSVEKDPGSTGEHSDSVRLDQERQWTQEEIGESLPQGNVRTGPEEMWWKVVEEKYSEQRKGSLSLRREKKPPLYERIWVLGHIIRFCRWIVTSIGSLIAAGMIAHKLNKKFPLKEPTPETYFDRYSKILDEVGLVTS